MRAVPPVFRSLLGLLPRSVARRLYSAAALTNLALFVLAVSTILYVRITSGVVEQLHRESLTSSAAAEIEILLERHRRIVEAAPVQIDRLQLYEDGKTAAVIAEELRHQVNNHHDAVLRGLADQLPQLLQLAQSVLHLAENFAQDEAIKAVDRYQTVAENVRLVAHEHRARISKNSAEQVAGLVARGQDLTRWVLAIAVVALMFAGLLNFILIQNFAGRIKRLTEGMRRIASNDTAHSVPFMHDADEIGEMARALEVFRRNAIKVIANAAEIEKLNGWFELALDNMARGLSMFDADERLIVCNRRYRELYAIPERLTKPGTPLIDIIDNWLASGEAVDRSHTHLWLSKMRATIARGAPFSETQQLADGRIVTVNIQPLQSGGWVDLHEDVTEQRRAEARISQLARFDTLTGLANRHEFHEQLQAALARAGDGSSFALIWLDLDKFKEVNDTLGHPVGDALLKAVAKRLTDTARSTDIIARLGGDEFAILQLGSAIGEKSAFVLANRIIKEINRPFPVLGVNVSVGTSIGIALGPEHGATAEELLKKADIALYRAKTEGRGRAVIFTGEMEQKLRSRRRMEADLRAAVSGNGLQLYYQPLISLKSGQVTSCEALMRWLHPELGHISPAEFIPLAEDIGLIGKLGNWAIERACRDAAGWPEHVKVAVNLSAAQFAASDLATSVRGMLDASGLSPQRLELEVTESVLLQENTDVLTTLQGLRALGVAIALDDFGTGYSSLSYLRSFPFDKIKIDQSFVRDLPKRDDCVAIVRGVVNLAKTLGMRSVAEGVETADHLGQVVAAGCDEVQGYYFSRPVPAGEIVDVIGRCEENATRAA